MIFISAAPLNDDWQKYRKAGMNAFLQKPFTEEMLLTTIQAVIRKNSPVTLTETGTNGRPGSGSTGKIDLAWLVSHFRRR